MFEDLLDWVGDLYDRLWPLSQAPWDQQPNWLKRALEAVTLMLVVLLFILVVAWILGLCSRPSRPVASAPPKASTSSPGVVYLHVVVYNRPPCTVTPMVNITLEPN